MAAAGLGTVTLVLSLAAASAAPGVVPWLDEQPVKASAHPPLAAACRATQLDAHLFLQGATGSLVGGVVLRNAGTQACSLVGRPSVSFAGTTRRWRAESLARSPEPPDVLADPQGSLRALQPGKSASVWLVWSNWCGPPPAAIVLALASGTSVRIATAHAPRCDAAQYASTIEVAPFIPTPRHLAASSRLPLRVAIVGQRPVRIKPGLRAFRAGRGEVFRYVVAVTNAAATPFRFAATSCPLYIEQLAGGMPQAFVLNCRAVGPIAPRATVRFAMRIAIPRSARLGNESLTWELAPKTYAAPFAAAAIRVGTRARITFRWLRMLDSSYGYALSGEDPARYLLLSTSDGGHTWRQVTAVHPSGPLSILGQMRWFSTSVGRGVFAVERSEDGGRSWHRSLPFRDPRGETAGQPFALDPQHLFLAVDEGAAAGSQSQALYTSSDGGRRWHFVSRTSTTDPSALPFGCDKSGFGFATVLRGWAGGYCAGGAPFSYRTDDGGRTWRRQPLPAPSLCACETSAPAFFSADVGAVYVSGFAANGGGTPFVRVFWTHDGGAHWRGSGPPLGRTETVSFVDARSVWITGQRRGDLRGRFDLVARTDDAGAHWQMERLPFDAGNTGFEALSPMVAYAYSANVIRLTRDGGRTWRQIHAAMIAG